MKWMKISEDYSKCITENYKHYLSKNYEGEWIHEIMNLWDRSAENEKL